MEKKKGMFIRYLSLALTLILLFSVLQTKSIMVGGEAVYLGEGIRAVWDNDLYLPDSGSFRMGGTSYSRGLVSPSDRYSNIQLVYHIEGQGFTRLSGYFGQIDGGNLEEGTAFLRISIYDYNTSNRVNTVEYGLGKEPVQVDYTLPYPYEISPFGTSNNLYRYEIQIYAYSITSTSNTGYLAFADAYFWRDLPQPTVTITPTAFPSNGGTVTGGGTYHHGEYFYLQAIPNSGWKLDGWYFSDGTLFTTSSGLWLISDVYDPSFSPLQARFSQTQPQQVIVTARASPSNGGTATGGGIYSSGQTATLMATANNGYTFDGWYEVNFKVSDNSLYSFTVTSERTLEARFVLAAQHTPVTSVTGIPTMATVGTPLTLSGTVNPSDATNNTITWSLVNAGTTGATIIGNTLNATATGSVTVRATIANGGAVGSNYTQDFNIAVSTGFEPIEEWGFGQTHEHLEGIVGVPFYYKTALPLYSVYGVMSDDAMIQGDAALPVGLTLDEERGVISGIPVSSGVYKFSVYTFGDYSIREIGIDYTLTIASATDTQGFTDPGLSIVEYVGDIVANHWEKTDLRDDVFVIEGGNISEFSAFYFNGEMLARGVDYVAEAGSVKIIVYSKAFENYGEGTHTIAAEFNIAGETKVAAQTFTLRLPDLEPVPGAASPVAPQRLATGDPNNEGNASQFGKPPQTSFIDLTGAYISFCVSIAVLVALCIFAILLRRAKRTSSKGSD